MHRYLRTFIGALALLLLVAGAAWAAPSQKGLDARAPAAASHQPSDKESKPSEDESEPSHDESSDEQKTTADAADAGQGPSDKLLDRIVTNFADLGIETDADTVAGLAEKYGVGGAVRILSLADATGKDPSEISDLFDAGMGWGQIVKQLAAEDDSLNLSPGIGNVMSGGKSKGGEHGNSANAPGHNK